jgi:hypothetical protein
MAALSLLKRNKMPSRPALYHYPEADVYECLGCGQYLETPYRAVLRNGQPAVSIKNHPEHRLVWLELMEMDHAACGSFKDAKKAEEARLFRRWTVKPRGDDGRHRDPAPVAP